VRIAVVGDVHRCWTPSDSLALDALAYDLVLFVGDLPDRLHRGLITTARAIATLKTPAVMIPGNHDGPDPVAVALETLHRTPRTRLGPGRLDRLQQALGPVALGGYRIHRFPDHDVSVIVGRPFAMDGRRCSFAPLLDRRHGVASMATSIRRLQELVEIADGRLVFLAHNGPLGLGPGTADPWSLQGRDLGDPDLAAAVHHARRLGRDVAAVCAGHQHHDGRNRRWSVRRDGVLYVNAARVPRRTRRGGHHIALDLGQGPPTAEALWVD
jgi:uncharacterized protein (TIGR04168 family)